MKITFQYVLWDALKEMSDDEVRKAVHVARLYAYMIVKGGMNLNALKVLSCVIVTACCMKSRSSHRDYDRFSTLHL